MRIARVMDQNPQFLQFVDRANLKPGTQVVVKQRDELADAVIVLARGSTVTLGSSSAAKILVEPR